MPSKPRPTLTSSPSRTPTTSVATSPCTTKGNNGSTISWKVTGGKDIATLGEGVNDKSRTVTVKRPAAGSDAVTVTLKAIASTVPATETKTFTVTIQPMPAAEEKDEAYVWAFHRRWAWARENQPRGFPRATMRRLEHAEQWHSAVHFRVWREGFCAIRSS